MNSKFSGREILEFAVTIEENGKNFYKDMSNKVKNVNLKDVFIQLSEDEQHHKEKFMEILSGLEEFKVKGNFTQEYFSYLKSYADSIIFNKDKTSNFKFTAPENILEILDFAISIEKDSIHYYLEIKDIVSHKEKYIIDEIINEERKHYLKLQGVKNII